MKKEVLKKEIIKETLKKLGEKSKALHNWDSFKTSKKMTLYSNVG